MIEYKNLGALNEACRLILRAAKHLIGCTHTDEIDPDLLLSLTESAHHKLEIAIHGNEEKSSIDGKKEKSGTGSSHLDALWKGLEENSKKQRRKKK